MTAIMNPKQRKGVINTTRKRVTIARTKSSTVLIATQLCYHKLVFKWTSLRLPLQGLFAATELKIESPIYLPVEKFAWSESHLQLIASKLRLGELAVNGSKLSPLNSLNPRDSNSNGISGSR